HPAVLQRGEYETPRRDDRARADLDIGDRLRDDFVAGGVESRDPAVIEVARILAFLARFHVDVAVLGFEHDGRAVLCEAAFDADSVGDFLHGMVGRRLVSDAAVPGRAGALLSRSEERRVGKECRFRWWRGR